MILIGVLETTAIGALILRVSHAQGAQAHGRQQFIFDHGENGPFLSFAEGPKRQGDGKQLIGPQ